MIGLVVCCINKKSGKMSPYELWSTHYSEKKANPLSINPKESNEDIHHFYTRSPRPSINPNPVFTPHISSNPSYRNSQLGGQLGSQRNSLRVSFPNRSPQHNYAL